VSNVNHCRISVFPSILAIFLWKRVVNSSGMHWSIWAMPWLPNLRDQKLSTLHWCSISWWHNIDGNYCFAWKGCQYFVSDLLPLWRTQITPDARPQIVDSLLMINVMKVQHQYHALCCLKRVLLLQSWIITMEWHLNYPRCTTNNRSCYVGTAFQDWTASLLLLFLPLVAPTVSEIDV
jgi:hypothetical protein